MCLRRSAAAFAMLILASLAGCTKTPEDSSTAPSASDTQDSSSGQTTLAVPLEFRRVIDQTPNQAISGPTVITGNFDKPAAKAIYDKLVGK